MRIWLMFLIWFAGNAFANFPSVEAKLIIQNHTDIPIPVIIKSFGQSKMTAAPNPIQPGDNVYTNISYKSKDVLRFTLRIGDTGNTPWKCHSVTYHGFGTVLREDPAPASFHCRMISKNPRDSILIIEPV